ncbi:MAG: hypothetical protein HZA58_08860, partial [Acidimicrobiia bacterium]|nr:hypothetical protein [Acidimicrobiia bacterium]
MGRAGTPRWRRALVLAAAGIVAGLLAPLDTASAALAPQSFDIRIASGSDDVEQNSNGYLYTDSSDLELTTEGTIVQTIGLRFRGVAIPAGATVSAAWVQFAADETSSGATQLAIRGVAQANPLPFSGTGNVSARPTTVAQVPWSPAPWTAVGLAGTAQRTPDLTSVLNELLAAPGWTSGNAIAFTITGTGSRVAESYEGSAAAAPLLHVEYTLNGGNAPPQVTAQASATKAPGVTTLTGTAVDDGLPSGTLTWQWAQTAGPAVTIADPAALITTAAIAVAGTYRFTLTASDGALGGSATAIITADGSAGPQPRLPDLISVPPAPGRQKFTIGDPTFPALDGRLLLRFDGYVTNVGQGPLHITGNPQHLVPTDLNSHDVWQWAEQADGSLLRVRKVPVRYETDDDHNHFHFMELVRYSLFVGDGSSGQVAAGGQKVGFCLEDTELVPGHADPGPKTYTYQFTGGCGQDNPGATTLVMGVTDGWRDVYGWDTNFQWVDVSDVVPGEYRVGTTADPNDLVVETNETNPTTLSTQPTIIPGHAPVAATATTGTGAPVAITLASTTFTSTFTGAPAVGASRYSITALPAHGQLDVGIGPITGATVTYTPTPGYTGPDSFRFGVRDATSAFPITTPTAAVTITVAAATANTPPQVSVSATAVASPGGTTTLSATVSDDGLPNPPATTTWTWSQQSGPAATITDPAAPTTTAVLPVAGTYVFLGTAHDGAATTTGTATVTVTDPLSNISDYRISAGGNDVEQTATGSLYTNSSDLELTVDATTQTVGLRFVGVAIPRGAVIRRAWLQFTVDETGAGASALQVSIQAIGNAAPFSGSFGVTSRAVAGTPVAWNPPPWNAIGAATADQRTPDLAALLQLVIARPDWVSGNALVFIVTGTGTRTAESYEGSRSTA